MQAPLIVFDHLTKTVAVVPTGPSPDRRVAELIATQQQQVATSGRPK
jgi:hypothetical protein